MPLPLVAFPRRTPSAWLSVRLNVAWEPEVDTAMARVEPAARDHLRTGEEMHSVGPVRVRVTEERALPTSEGVGGDRHRDRHVDAHHADLHLVLEAPRRTTVVREDRGAVAVRI